MGVEGKDVEAHASSSGVMINDAKVIKADVVASNGVVHVIDHVLLPPTMFSSAESNIVELAESVPDLSTLVAALKAGGLVETLEGPGPFTVFAPTNEAFNALPDGVLADLLKPENKDKLVNILTYHVASGDVMSKAIKNRERIKTVEGKDVEAHVSSSGVMINDAKVIKADVVASNGVVHVIDHVLLPPTMFSSAESNIVELAESVPDLSTLVAALKAGGLVE